MRKQLELKALSLAIKALWPMARHGVPGAKQGLIVAIRWRVQVGTGLRARVTIHPGLSEED